MCAQCVGVLVEGLCRDEHVLDDVVNGDELDVVIVVMPAINVNVIGDVEDENRGRKEPLVRNVFPEPQVGWGCKLDISRNRSLGNGDVV